MSIEMMTKDEMLDYFEDVESLFSEYVLMINRVADESVETELMRQAINAKNVLHEMLRVLRTLELDESDWTRISNTLMSFLVSDIVLDEMEEDDGQSDISRE